MRFVCNGHNDIERAMCDMKLCDDFLALPDHRQVIACEVACDLAEQALDDAVYRMFNCPLGKGICPFEFMDEMKKKDDTKELHYQYHVQYPDFHIVMSITF